MPYSSYHDHNRDDWHDRDLARFRRDESQRFPVVSEGEISDNVTTQPEIEQPTPEPPDA